MTWQEKVLDLWDEKPNWENNEVIVLNLYNRSKGLIQPLYKFLQQIAIAQLENTLNPSSEEVIDINEIIGATREPKADF